MSSQPPWTSAGLPADESGGPPPELQRDEEVRRLRLQLKDADARLERVEAEHHRVVHAVSHDLRAPIRAVEGFATILLEDHGAALPHDASDYLRRIVQAAKRMDRLVTDLLMLSRVSTLRLEPAVVDLDVVLDDVLVHRAREAEASGASIEAVRPLGRVTGHPSLVFEALDQLVGNALKFTRPGAAPDVRVYATAAPSLVRLWVEDRGVGVPAEARRRIFDVFERLHAESDYPGTGVGLALVNRIAERLQGRAGVEGKEGEGSRFWLELPAAEEPPPS